MATTHMTVPDVREFQPSLVLQLRDAFTDSNILQGDVTVTIGKTSPFFQKESEATFVFARLPAGSYTANVSSSPDQPYYWPVAIPITLPLASPADTAWPQPWVGYPNVTLADPTLTLDDPAQSAAYLAQRDLTSLQPTTAYPFPSGTTLVRGLITAANAPVSGAFVTLALLGQPGQFPVTVVNPDGTTSAAKTLSVVATPVIVSLSPALVIAGGPAFLLTVQGTGFVSSAQIRVAGVALATTFLSSSALTAQILRAAIANAGPLSVVVGNPDGSVSNQLALTVAAAPATTSIDPPSVSVGSAAFTVTVQGSGFAPNAAIQMQGAAVKTTFINSTQLSASVPAAQVAFAAQISVVVANPGPPQQISNAQTLSVVNTPVISALDPSTVIAGNADFTLTVLGTGYAAGSTVKLNGAALPTTYGSSTELSASITGAQVAAAGVLNITVTNPNGFTSAAQVLTVATGPAITSIAPTSVTAGSTFFTLVVVGSGFVSGSVVALNGTQLATSFITDTQLAAHVPRSGYTTGADGTFVLYFDEQEFDAITGRSQTVTLIVTQQGNPKQTSQDVTVLRGATVSVDIDVT